MMICVRQYGVCQRCLGSGREPGLPIRGIREKCSGCDGKQHILRSSYYMHDGRSRK